MFKEHDEKWYAQLSEAELDQAEQIEKDTMAAFAEGWSEETAGVFVHAVMQIWKKMPELAIRNIVDCALREGVIALLAEVYGFDRNAPRKPKRANGKSKLSGAGV